MLFPSVNIYEFVRNALCILVAVAMARQDLGNLKAVCHSAVNGNLPLCPNNFRNAFNNLSGLLQY